MSESRSMGVGLEIAQVANIEPVFNAPRVETRETGVWEKNPDIRAINLAVNGLTAIARVATVHSHSDPKAKVRISDKDKQAFYSTAYFPPIMELVAGIGYLSMLVNLRRGVGNGETVTSLRGYLLEEITRVHEKDQELGEARGYLPSGWFEQVQAFCNRNELSTPEAFSAFKEADPSGARLVIDQLQQYTSAAIERSIHKVNLLDDRILLGRSRSLRAAPYSRRSRTEIKAGDSLDTRLDQATTVLAGIAHDLGNAITPVKLSIQMVQRLLNRVSEDMTVTTDDDRAKKIDDLWRVLLIACQSKANALSEAFERPLATTPGINVNTLLGQLSEALRFSGPYSDISGTVSIRSDALVLPREFDGLETLNELAAGPEALYIGPHSLLTDLAANIAQNTWRMWAGIMSTPGRENDEPRLSIGSTLVRDIETSKMYQAVVVTDNGTGFPPQMLEREAVTESSISPRGLPKGFSSGFHGYVDAGSDKLSTGVGGAVLDRRFKQLGGILTVYNDTDPTTGLLRGNMLLLLPLAQS